MTLTLLEQGGWLIFVYEVDPEASFESSTCVFRVGWLDLEEEVDPNTFESTPCVSWLGSWRVSLYCFCSLFKYVRIFRAGPTFSGNILNTGSPQDSIWDYSVFLNLFQFFFNRHWQFHIHTKFSLPKPHCLKHIHRWWCKATDRDKLLFLNRPCLVHIWLLPDPNCSICLDKCTR